MSVPHANIYTKAAAATAPRLSLFITRRALGDLFYGCGRARPPLNFWPGDTYVWVGREGVCGIHIERCVSWEACDDGAV